VFFVLTPFLISDKILYYHIMGGIQMKKFLSAVLVFIMCFLAVCTNVFAYPDWAQKDISYLNDKGISINAYDLNASVTREQFAQLLYDSFKAYAQKDVTMPEQSPFSDTTSEAATAVYELGIVTGAGDGTFNPSGNLTRQEAAKMLCRFFTVLKGDYLSHAYPKAYLYADFEKISPWALDYVSAISTAGIMSGREIDKFVPDGALTVLESAVLVSRIMQSDGSSINEAKTPQITESQTAKVIWNDMSDADKYYIKIIEYRNTYHGLEMGAKDPVYYMTEEKQLIFNTKPVRRYEITITNGKERAFAELGTNQLRSWSENLSEIEAYGLPTTKEEADALMETITIDIWTIKNGEKVPSTTTLTVHKAIAEKVQLIFKEIFEGEEKFPIKSIGGYSWRGGKSEHNYGTAIDINPNENYCIYTSGSIVGEFYKPYVSPYSIKPFGEVVEIFEKYGFNWGADTWRGNRDFMHFSYCGT